MTRRWFDLLTDDHTTIEKVFAAVERTLASPERMSPVFAANVVDFLGVYVEECHNKKEENHLFPLIRERGIPAEGGPLAIMLAEHERQGILVKTVVEHGRAFAEGDPAALPPFRGAFEEYAALCREHYWKENDILYPMAVRVMSSEDEAVVMKGIEQVEASLGEDTHEKYYALAARIVEWGDVKDLALGLDRDVLACMLNTLPVEISFIDADDTVQYFSHEDHDKIFSRNRSAIGTKVQQCHPPQSVHLVNKILEDFKAGKRELAEFWIDFREKFVHIRYMPVRNDEGTYLGCMEVVQDIKPIRELEGERRLLAEA